MTTKQQLKIDLTKLRYGPHPLVDKAFTDNRAEHLHFKEGPSYRNEERIILCSQASGKPIKFKITGLYRRQLADGEEYVIFHLAELTYDYFGNIVTFSKLCGRYELPVFSKVYGIPIGRRLVSNTDVTKTMEANELDVNIDHYDQIHEWRFEDIKEQLKDWYQQGVIDSNTKLYAWQGTSKYNVQKFEDFLNQSLDDLILIGRAGTRFAGLLKDQIITPEILNKLREKLTGEVLTEISKK